MKLSELIADCQTYLIEYGDLDVGILQGETIFEPVLCHSENDYFDSFLSGSSWKDLGVTEPIFILDANEVMEFPEEDEYEDDDDYEDE